jgi:rhodanese-related sulfurtransferase
MAKRIDTILRRPALILSLVLVLLLGISRPSFPAGASPLNDGGKLQKVMDMYAAYRQDFPGVPEIEPRAAIALLSDPGVVFVDVRSAEEQAVSMIPGALTKEDFMVHLDRYQSQRIIAYCTISYRSGKLAAKLRRRGVTLVNLKYGLLGWVHAGGPLMHAGQPVRRLHVYGAKWDLAPAGIETVY